MKALRRTAAVCCLAAAALILVSAPAWAIEVMGTATFKGEGEAGKQAAIRLALRDACEKGCGVFLNSQKNVHNRDQVFDKVVTQTAGFISDYKVQRADFLEDSWSVVVAANVSPEKFADAWKLTYIQVNSPRLMVVVSEERDGQMQALRTVQAAIESFLLKKGFRLVDKSQFSEVKESRLKEAALGDDLASAASVARDFGAELLVIGHARAEKGNPKNITDDIVFQTYTAQVVVKVVQADSASLVVTTQARAEGQSQEAPKAAAVALEQLSKQVPDKVWKGCVENWEKMVSGNYRTELNVSGVTPEGVIALQKQLKELQGVSEVNLRRMASGAAQFDILSTFSTEDLFKLIVSSKALPSVEVTGVTQNVIQAKWKAAEGT